MYCSLFASIFIHLFCQVDFVLDSFIELIPSKSKKRCDHYVTYKKLNQVWIRIDNENIKKATLSGQFRVNLAFYKNSQTGTSVTYNIDFAQIKSYRGRRSVSFAKSINVLEDNPPNKSRKKNKSAKIPTKSSIEEDLPSTSEGQDAVPSTSSSDQLTKPYPEMSESAQSLIQGESEPITAQTDNTEHISGEIQNTSSDISNEPTNTIITTEVTSEISVPEPNDNLGSQQPGNVTETNTSPKNNDGSSDDTIIDSSKTSVENNSPLKITSVISLAGAPPSDDNLEKSLGGVHSAMSAEDLQPLELSQRLHVRVEKYVNLLKRYQEGNVREKPLREQDVRLTNIKEKTISLQKFQDFYKDKSQEGSKPSTQTEESKQPSGNSPNREESDSSSEADNSECDEDYEPDDDQEELEIDLSLQTAKPKAKPSKSEGTKKLFFILTHAN